MYNNDPLDSLAKNQLKKKIQLRRIQSWKMFTIRYLNKLILINKRILNFKLIRKNEYKCKLFTKGSNEKNLEIGKVKLKYSFKALL